MTKLLELIGWRFWSNVLKFILCLPASLSWIFVKSGVIKISPDFTVIEVTAKFDLKFELSIAEILYTKLHSFFTLVEKRYSPVEILFIWTSFETSELHFVPVKSQDLN